MRPTLFAVLFLVLGSCLPDSGLFDKGTGQSHFGTFTHDDLVGSWICNVDWELKDSEETEIWEIIFTKEPSGEVDLAFVNNNDFYNILNDSLDPHFLFYADGTLVISVDYGREDSGEGFTVYTYDWDLELDAGANGWTGTQQTSFENYNGGEGWAESNHATVVGVKQ